MASVNFENLKFNLYEVLGVNRNDNEIKIKKHFKKLVIEMHPDKNPDSNEEIFDHVMTASQILLNPISRKEYDDFLDGHVNQDSFVELKKNFGKEIKNTEKYFVPKEQAIGKFKEDFENLNKKHGVSDKFNNKNIMSEYEKIKQSRQNDITIPQEKIENQNDFNSKFEQRLNQGVFQDQIIEFNKHHEINTYQPNDQLVSIGDYSRLYAEDTISTGQYTSLDSAFKIQKIDVQIPEKSLKERMEEYKNNTSYYSNLPPELFERKKYDKIV